MQRKEEFSFMLQPKHVLRFFLWILNVECQRKIHWLTLRLKGRSSEEGLSEYEEWESPRTQNVQLNTSAMLSEWGCGKQLTTFQEDSKQIMKRKEQREEGPLKASNSTLHWALSCDLTIWIGPPPQGPRHGMYCAVKFQVHTTTHNPLGIITLVTSPTSRGLSRHKRTVQEPIHDSSKPKAKNHTMQVLLNTSLWIQP